MHDFNNESKLWVAWGGMVVGGSVLWAAYGRHGLTDAVIQERWGIAVDYARFMSLGLWCMVLMRVVAGFQRSRHWPERILVLGTGLFCGMLFAESLWPTSTLLITVGWLAPVGGILMTFSWLAFVLEFIRHARSTP